MTKKHKKPVGSLNPMRITNGKIEKAPNKFVFPDTKHEIEKKVAKTFLALLEKSEISPFSTDAKLKENEENNLDFSVLDGEESFLELTEITPPGKMKGGYSDLAFEHNIGAHLDKTVLLILKKSAKYVGLKKEVNLLMYITDDRSLPSPTTERLIKCALNKSDHIFKNVFAFYPLLENDGPILRFFPNEEVELTEDEIQRYRLNNVKNLRLK